MKAAVRIWLRHWIIDIQPLLQNGSQKTYGKNLVREHHIPEVLENDWQIFQFLRQVDDKSGEEMRSMYLERVQQFFKEELEARLNKLPA